MSNVFLQISVKFNRIQTMKLFSWNKQEQKKKHYKVGKGKKNLFSLSLPLGNFLLDSIISSQTTCEWGA